MLVGCGAVGSWAWIIWCCPAWHQARRLALSRRFQLRIIPSYPDRPHPPVRRHRGQHRWDEL